MVVSACARACAPSLGLACQSFVNYQKAIFHHHKNALMRPPQPPWVPLVAHSRTQGRRAMSLRSAAAAEEGGAFYSRFTRGLRSVYASCTLRVRFVYAVFMRRLHQGPFGVRGVYAPFTLGFVRFTSRSVLFTSGLPPASRRPANHHQQQQQ